MRKIVSFLFVSFICILSFSLAVADVTPEQALHTFPDWNTQGDIVVYSHGFTGCWKDWRWLESSHFLDKDFYYPVSFDYAEVKDIKDASLAQTKDLACLSQAMEEVSVLREKNKNKKTLGIGYSRGAAALLNGVACAQEDKTLCSIANFDALILIAPFACVEWVVRQRVNKNLGFENDNFFSRFMARTLHYMGIVNVWYAKSYDRSGVQPIDVVDTIPFDIPILLVTSLEDEVCSTNGVRMLYVTLKAQGRDNVYLLEVPKGGHCEYFSRQENVDLMRPVFSAFYEKYGFENGWMAPCAKDLDLKEYQPLAKEVLNRLAKK